MSYSRLLRRSASLFAALALSACGFALRGSQPLPVQSIFVQIGQYSELGAEIRRELRANGTVQLVDAAQDAEAELQVLADRRDREILSLNASGRVREYRLREVLAFKLVARDGREIIPYSEIRAYRDLTFDDNQVLAKDQEQAFLYRDMQADVVQQLMRRLAAAKPLPPAPAPAAP